jgi:hypothetical protein
MRQGSRCQEAPGPDEVQHHLSAVWPTSFSAPAAVRAGRGDRVSVTVDHRPICGAAVPERRKPSRLRAIPMASNSPFCNCCVRCFPGFGGPPGRRLSRLVDLFPCDDRNSTPLDAGCLHRSLQIFWASRRQDGSSRVCHCLLTGPDVLAADRLQSGPRAQPARYRRDKPTAAFPPLYLAGLAVAGSHPTDVLVDGCASRFVIDRHARQEREPSALGRLAGQSPERGTCRRPAAAAWPPSRMY